MGSDWIGTEIEGGCTNWVPEYLIFIVDYDIIIKGKI